MNVRCEQSKDDDRWSISVEGTVFSQDRAFEDLSGSGMDISRRLLEERLDAPLSCSTDEETELVVILSGEGASTPET